MKIIFEYGEYEAMKQSLNSIIRNDDRLTDAERMEILNSIHSLEKVVLILDNVERRNQEDEG